MIGGVEILIQFIFTAILIFLFLYFMLIFHESGHAFFAIIFTNHEVKIRLGGYSDKKIFKIGRLIVCLNGFNPWYGTVQWNTESLSNIKRVFIYLGGPIFTISLSCVLWWLMKSNIFLYLSNYILQFMFISSVWQFIITMAPIKYTRLWDAYEGMNSDGLNILNILFKEKININ